jgi:hypothetical protein
MPETELLTSSEEMDRKDEHSRQIADICARFEILTEDYCMGTETGENRICLPLVLFENNQN